MTDPENQLHAAGSPAKHGGFHHDKGCSNAFGDNPMRVLVPLLEFNLNWGVQQRVEEFIEEIEGPPATRDVTRWSQFSDIRDIKKEMLQGLEAQFENWLSP
jgi:hypothetical protein